MPLINAAARTLQREWGNGLPTPEDVLGASARIGVVTLGDMDRAERAKTLGELLEAGEDTTVLLIAALHPLDEARVRTLAVEQDRPFRALLQAVTRLGLRVLVDAR